MVFNSTDTVLELALATIRSGRPSPFTSSSATDTGPLPVAKVCWGAKLGVVAPAVVVFKNTDTVLELALATIRSVRPSPFTSPSATEVGALPVAKVCWAAKLGATTIGVSVFSSTETVVPCVVLVPKSATARSGRPSPLKSPSATEMGATPVAKVVCGAKLAVAAPGAVVFNKTDTV